MINKFDAKVIDELKKPLNKDHVKTREHSKVTLAYMEGWQVIDEANRIFDFAWDRETIYCKEVCRYEVKLGKDKKIPGWKVGYEAKVRITVNGVVKEGTGHGSGIMGDLFDCIESASKESETDAMKRALMMFGYPFGLALYDKKREHVADYSAIDDDYVDDKADLKYFIPIPFDDNGNPDWTEYTSLLIDAIESAISFEVFNGIRADNLDEMLWLKKANEKLRSDVTDVSRAKAEALKSPKQPQTPLEAYDDIINR